MKKLVAPIGVAAALSAGALFLAGTATAQAPPINPPSGSCNSAAGVHVFGSGFNDAWVFSTPPVGQSTSVTQTLSASIPAGTYDLITLSWDGSATRASDVQPLEIYFIELLDGASNVLATSGVTPDLLDGVTQTEWSGSIGQVTWAGADATQVRVVHGAAGTAGPNSVHARCLGWTPVQVTTTTTTTTTTSTSTTSTTSTPVDPTTTTTSTTTSTTTTQPPTVVLPEIEVSQPPTPVQGEPTFTG